MEGIEKENPPCCFTMVRPQGESKPEPKEIDNGDIPQRFHTSTIMFGYLTIEYEDSGSWEECLWGHLATF